MVFGVGVGVTTSLPFISVSFASQIYTGFNLPSQIYIQLNKSERLVLLSQISLFRISPIEFNRISCKVSVCRFAAYIESTICPRGALSLFQNLGLLLLQHLLSVINYKPKSSMMMLSCLLKKLLFRKAFPKCNPVIYRSVLSLIKCFCLYGWFYCFRVYQVDCIVLRTCVSFFFLFCVCF